MNLESKSSESVGPKSTTQFAVENTICGLNATFQKTSQQRLEEQCDEETDEITLVVMVVFLFCCCCWMY